jgi:hypothetical protein
VKYCIKDCSLCKEDGQALTEFILFAMLFALFFGGMMHLQKKSTQAVNKIISARNNVFNRKNNGSNSSYLAYANRTVDLGRFRVAYLIPIYGEQAPVVELINKSFTTYQFKNE